MTGAWQGRNSGKIVDSTFFQVEIFSELEICLSYRKAKEARLWSRICQGKPVKLQ